MLRFGRDHEVDVVAAAEEAGRERRDGDGPLATHSASQARPVDLLRASPAWRAQITRGAAQLVRNPAGASSAGGVRCERRSAALPMPPDALYDQLWRIATARRPELQERFRRPPPPALPPPDIDCDVPLVASVGPDSLASASLVSTPAAAKDPSLTQSRLRMQSSVRGLLQRKLQPPPLVSFVTGKQHPFAGFAGALRRDEEQFARDNPTVNVDSLLRFDGPPPVLGANADKLRSDAAAYNRAAIRVYRARQNALGRGGSATGVRFGSDSELPSTRGSSRTPSRGAQATEQPQERDPRALSPDALAAERNVTPTA